MALCPIVSCPVMAILPKEWWNPTLPSGQRLSPSPWLNEYLNSELTPHRKVFEVLADKMKTPYQEHQLSGLGFSSTMRNSVIVKVDGTFSRTLKVNF